MCMKTGLPAMLLEMQNSLEIQRTTPPDHRNTRNCCQRKATLVCLARSRTGASDTASSHAPPAPALILTRATTIPREKHFENLTANHHHPSLRGAHEKLASVHTGRVPDWTNVRRRCCALPHDGWFPEPEVHSATGTISMLLPCGEGRNPKMRTRSAHHALQRVLSTLGFSETRFIPIFCQPEEHWF